MVLKFDAKADFQKSPESKQYREFMASTAFNKGSTAALLRYADTLTQSGSDDAAIKFYKQQGAREFLGVLLNLTEELDTPKPPAMRQLNPHV